MEFPAFKRGDFEKEFKFLSLKDKNDLKEYEKYCSINANSEKALDMKRNLLKFRLVISKELNKTSLKDLRNYLSLLNKASVSDYTKNDMKVHIKKFLKWKFKNWSEKFNAFEDIKQITNPRRKRKIDETTILSKEEIEKIMKTETKMFWKSFFITQYEGALRTKECRFLKWNDLKEEGDFYVIDLFATKTKENRPIVLKEAKFYLDKLREEQENNQEKGVYIFHSKKNINSPIDKATISVWLRKLSKKALGREIWAYVLRHTRGSEYRTLVKEGKLSKDNAIETMGHSEKMFDRTYSHLDKEDIKEMIKEQLYSFEDLPPEKKAELEEQIKSLNEKLKDLEDAEIQRKKEFETSERKKENSLKKWQKMISEQIKAKR